MSAKRRLKAVSGAVLGTAAALLALRWAVYGALRLSPQAAIAWINASLYEQDPQTRFDEESWKVSLEKGLLSLPLQALRWNASALPAVAASVARQDYKVRARLQLAAVALEQEMTPEERSALKVPLVYLSTAKYGYAGAAELAWGFAADAEARPFVLEALEKSAEPGMKAAILAHVGDWKVAEAVPVLEGLLKAPDTSLARDVYRALGGIGGPAAYDVLSKSLRLERDQRSLPEILRAMGRTRDPRSKAVLERYLNAQEDSLRDAAAEGLRALGPTS